MQMPNQQMASDPADDMNAFAASADSVSPSRKRRKRPFGITALIVLQLILTLGSLMELYFTGPLSLEALLPSGQDVSELLLTIRNVSHLLALITLVGFWFLKRWAWVLMMLHVGIALTVLLLLYSSGTALYIRMVILVVCAFYLNQRDVQFAFQHPWMELETL